MGLYKIIIDGKITDVVNNPIWVKDGRNGFPIRCDVNEACGIVGHDEETIYQISGAPIMLGKYDVVGVADIDEDEYENLKTILELDGAVDDFTSTIEWIQDSEEEPEPETNLDLITAIERKLTILSAACQDAIVQGVDVTLSDGSVKHFDLTVEDQINLLEARRQAATGAESALFKAANEDLKYYTLSDIDLIANAASIHINYHRSYFESLRKWVRNAKTMAELGAHCYGENIPEEYWSEVFQVYC